MNAENREIVLREGERIDDLHRNGYRIIQNEKAFCFGMDAVLLSGYAVVKPGERALDLGTGTGIIPILLEAKTAGSHFTGLEIQNEMAEMAGRSVRLNGLEEKIDIVTGDIKEAGRIFGAASFDVVTSNPPRSAYNPAVYDRQPRVEKPRASQGNCPPRGALFSGRRGAGRSAGSQARRPLLYGSQASQADRDYHGLYQA